MIAQDEAGTLQPRSRHPQSEQALERLEHASPAELDLWTGRILEAKSLEELFQA